jgi:hypothetical protein
VPLETPEADRVRRLGFLAGEIAAPDDFDRIGEAGIEQLFAAQADAVSSAVQARASDRARKHGIERRDKEEDQGCRKAPVRAGLARLF